MAMQATHVRFAVALEDRLDVTNSHAYYSGAVYPDSRYITGVSREVTHEGSVPADPYEPGLTDFQKGWATHLQYDLLANPITMQMFGYSIEQDIYQDAWIYPTAVKYIEDMKSARLLEEQMQHVFIDRAPEGEHLSALEKWYEALRNMYVTAPSSVADYAAINTALPVAVVEKLHVAVEELRSDVAMVQRIEGIFDKVLAQYVQS